MEREKEVGEGSDGCAYSDAYENEAVLRHGETPSLEEDDREGLEYCDRGQNDRMEVKGDTNEHTELHKQSTGSR